MIREVAFFIARCDRCGVDADYGDFAAMGEADQAWDMAWDSEWTKIDNRHLCPDCWRIDDDDQDVELPPLETPSTP